MRGLGIVEFDRNRKIEGVYQADVVVVATCGRARESKFSQARISGAGVLTLQQSATVPSRARSMPGAVEYAFPAAPEASADPRYRHCGGDAGARQKLKSAG